MGADSEVTTKAKISDFNLIRAAVGGQRRFDKYQSDVCPLKPIEDQMGHRIVDHL